MLLLEREVAYYNKQSLVILVESLYWFQEEDAAGEGDEGGGESGGVDESRLFVQREREYKHHKGGERLLSRRKNLRPTSITGGCRGFAWVRLHLRLNWHFARANFDLTSSIVQFFQRETRYIYR